MAGMIKIPRLRFMAFDIAGVTLWSGTYILLGYAFSQEIERIILYLSRFGTSLSVLIAAALDCLHRIQDRRATQIFKDAFDIAHHTGRTQSKDGHRGEYRHPRYAQPSGSRYRPVYAFLELFTCCPTISNFNRKISLLIRRLFSIAPVRMKRQALEWHFSCGASDCAGPFLSKADWMGGENTIFP